MTTAGERGPTLEARDLYRFFRSGDEETRALRGVSLSVSAGETVVVTGPSGSGKSTLMSCLAGLDEPTGGTVMVNGVRLSHQPEVVRARMRAEGIGVMTQSGDLLDHLSVLDNLKLTQRIGRRRNGGRASLPELLVELGIDERKHALPHELSGGEYARASLAVALANEPLVLLADEPTGELDGETEDRLLAALTSRAQRQVAIVVASHSPAVRRVADRVVGLHDGEVTT